MNSFLRLSFYVAVLSISFFFTFCKKNTISDIQADYFIKFFGNSGTNRGSDLCQTSDGGYVVLGTKIVSGKGTEIMLIKTDKFGNEEWIKTFGDSLDDYAKSIRITADGGFVILGTTTSNIISKIQTDMYLIKTDNLGNLQWDHKFLYSLCYMMVELQHQTK